MKYILAIVFLLISLTVYFVTRPQPEFKAGKSDNTEAVTGQVAAEQKAEPARIDPEQVLAAERRAAMTAEFEKLKKARRNLESRLARMKAVLWGVEVPKEEGDAINAQMKNGYALLKDQKLLGAYSGIEQISDELARIEFINNHLKEVEEKFRAERLQ